MYMTTWFYARFSRKFCKLYGIQVQIKQDFAAVIYLKNVEKAASSFCCEQFCGCGCKFSKNFVIVTAKAADYSKLIGCGLLI